MKDTSTFTTAITTENIVLEFDIQMGFPIRAKRAPAMQLCACVSHDLDTK